MLKWLREHLADVFKIGASYLVGSVALAFCLFTAWRYNGGSYVQVLICILGGVLGWIAGLAVTPSSADEKKTFTEYGKVIATFLSGFGLAQLKGFLDWLQVPEQATDDLIVKSLLFVCCFFIVGLFTYISRLHVGEADALQKKREAIVQELSVQVAKLKALR